MTALQCGTFEVIGSEQELKERAIAGWEEFEGHTPHRPWVDAVKIQCKKCGSEVSRIKDVGNPWLDAGIVPYLNPALSNESQLLGSVVPRRLCNRVIPRPV